MKKTTNKARKPRRAIITLEVETTLTLEQLREHVKPALGIDEGERYLRVIQTQVNAVR